MTQDEIRKEIGQIMGPYPSAETKMLAIVIELLLDIKDKLKTEL